MRRRDAFPWFSASVRLRGVPVTLLLLALWSSSAAAQGAPGLPPTPAPPPGNHWTLPALHFMAGCWEGLRGETLLEERYAPPRGGVILGTSLYLRGGAAVSWEFSRLVEDDQGVVLVPYPGGTRSAAGFRLTSLDGEKALFENPDHDFPTRIAYQRVPGAAGGPDVLEVSVSGGTRGFDYALRAVPCDRTPSTAPPFRAFSASGEPTSLGAALQAMAEAEVVFLGESHDDPVAHLLQEQVLRELHRRGGGARPTVLSLEMFESDVQGVVDEYLQGLITEDHFLRSARPWPNYGSDYRSLVEYARVQGLPVVAANPPRRYVNRVAREGPASLESLPAAARSVIPPLPLAPPSARYREAWDALMGGAGHGGTPGRPAGPAPAHGQGGSDPDISNGLWAQTLWDAGMAHAISGALGAAPGALVVHLAGSFHVERGTGIPEHLELYRPGTRTFTVVFRPSAPDAPFDAEAHGGLGDLVVLTDATLPRTR